MYCTRCGTCEKTNRKKLDLREFNIIGDIFRIDCNICQYFIAIMVNSDIIDIDQVADSHCIENGWKKMRTNREKIIYYILSQIIYREIDIPRREKFESAFDYADDGDEVFLRWYNGMPVGFYTIKRKGTEIYATLEKYSMNTVDTAYIRSQYRNQGFGLEILYHVIKRYPNEEIGFSKPISQGMLRILQKFLITHNDYRRLFWEIENGGAEGSIKLIWFCLRKQAVN